MTATVPLILHWMRLGPRKKWHGWPHGGHSTLCSTVTPLQLQNGRNMTEITTIPPVSHGNDVCVVCRRVARLECAPMELPPAAVGWYRLLILYATRMRVTCPMLELGQLAERMAEVGPPTDPSARETYGVLQRFLLTPISLRVGTRQHVPTWALKTILAVLPPGVAVVQRVVDAVRVWERVTGYAVEREKMNRSRVIAVMQQVPVVEPYIRHLHQKGRSSLAQMFHPSTLAFAQKDPALRGLFGGAQDYWNSTLDTLEVVR